MVFDRLEIIFDSLLYQFSKGITYESYEKGLRHHEFEQLKEWKSKFGFKFNIYGNDHLIDGKPHFHFDNKEKNIACKIDFQGSILEYKGSEVPAKTLKDLQFFLLKEDVQKIIYDKWNEKNPNLTIKYEKNESSN